MAEKKTGGSLTTPPYLKDAPAWPPALLLAAGMSMLPSWPDSDVCLLQLAGRHCL